MEVGVLEPKRLLGVLRILAQPSIGAAGIMRQDELGPTGERAEANQQVAWVASKLESRPALTGYSMAGPPPM